MPPRPAIPRMRWPANSSPSCRVGTGPLYSEAPHAPASPLGSAGADILGRVDARSERHSCGRVGGCGARRRPRRSSAAAFASRRPWSPPPPARRRSRCPWPCAARAARRRASCLPADVRLRRDLPDAQRRSRAPARAGAHALSGASPTASSASASCPACACSAPSRAARASRCGPSSRRSCGATGCGSACRTGRSPTCSPAGATCFARGATQIYAVFDLGLIGYWALPTAPPWFAAERAPWERASPACAA